MNDENNKSIKLSHDTATLKGANTSDLLAEILSQEICTKQYIFRVTYQSYQVAFTTANLRITEKYL